MTARSNKELIPQEIIENRIYLIRGEKVMLDSDLAGLYGVKTKQLKRQVKRNIDHFPNDFMFVLSRKEYSILRCQIGTLKPGSHAKYFPYVFTENGVAMLSSVLNSKRAILVNIQIMRTFTRIRKLLSSHKEILRRLDRLETGQAGQGEQIVQIFQVIKNILDLPVTLKRKPKKIGFVPPAVTR